MKIPNPNESECVARVVYPPPNADHKGSVLRFFAENVKIYFIRHYAVKLIPLRKGGIRGLCFSRGYLQLPSPLY